MKKILLTGGSGFIGRNLRESYLSQQYELIAPTHQELDLADTDAVDNFFQNKSFDVVIHAATKPGHRNAKDLNELLKTNLRLFENLARNSDHFGRLINLGSGAIYDISVNNASVTEDEIFQRMGKDDHSFCKYLIAKRIQALPNFVDLNIFGIFGKHEDYAIRFISNAICKSLFDLPITLRQNRRFSYLDVNDLPQVIAYFIENETKFKSYNVVPDGYVELAKIAEIVKEISGRNIEIKITNNGFGLDYYGSNQRLKMEIPGLKFTAIKESICGLYEYYQANQANLNYQCLLEDK